MKTILYLATTINGMIAKPDGDSDFVSKEQTEDFLLRCRQAGVVIMGRKTYEIIETLPLKDGLHIVLSHQLIKSDNPTVIFRDQNPQEIIQRRDATGNSGQLRG
ncbi:MAG: hypothetical protein UW69_C0064G0008 [Microgenomates group bacterium GW2011_GWA2_44_7]|nr:MAG: hypothetical protein UW69_C0064G0008 [Microgenomates group bacterium GW2011_GWA2_44_7]